MSTVIVKSQQDLLYKQEIKAGPFTFLADAPARVGGKEEAPDPHQLLLASLGACTAMTLQMFARRRGWDLQAVSIELSESKTDDPAQPGVHKSTISKDILLEGNLTSDQKERLQEVADKCPIHRLLSEPIEIVTTLTSNG